MSSEQGVVLVTGAGRGTGEAAALALGAAGAHIVAIDVNPDSAERTAEAIRSAGGQARAITADVSNKMSAQTLLYGLLEGGAQLTALVNAAHVVPASPALKMDEWEWNRTLEVNLKGVFLMSQTVARAMKETGGGLIVNVQRPLPVSPHAAVWAAHAGLTGLTDALAAEWGEWRVRVRLAPAAEAGALAVAWLQEPW